MPLGLQEAIERAELMAGDDLILNQQSYELLADKLEEEDQYPFTMSLTERGIFVRTSSSDQDNYDKLIRRAIHTAQAFQKSPGGVWAPDEWLEDETALNSKFDGEYELQDADYEILGDYGYDSTTLPSDFSYEMDDFDAPVPPPLPTDSDDDEADILDFPHSKVDPSQSDDIAEIRDTLESHGINVTSDGKVEMYKANLPGLYMQKKPRRPMPLDTAVKLYDQMLDGEETEQGRLGGLLDLLTRLSSATYDIEYNIDDMADYKFSPQSKNPEIVSIANGLEDLRGSLTDGNWQKSRRLMEDLRGELEEYSSGYGSSYDTNLDIVDALSRLKELQDSDPDAFNQAISGLGALASRRRVSYDSHTDELDDISDLEEVQIELNSGYVLEGADIAGVTDLSDVDVPALTKHLEAALEAAGVFVATVSIVEDPEVDFAFSGRPYDPTWTGGDPQMEPPQLPEEDFGTYASGTSRFLMSVADVLVDALDEFFPSTGASLSLTS